MPTVNKTKAILKLKGKAKAGKPGFGKVKDKKGC